MASHDWIPHSKPSLERADADSVGEAVRSGFVGAGRGAKEFEEKFAAYIGRANGRAAASGSAALHLALLAAGVGPGEAVIIPALVCRALLNVVLSTGATPVLADIDPSDLNVNLENAQAAAVTGKAAGSGKKPHFMIAVHSFGAPADLNLFKSLELTIVEDAASSLGARLNGRQVGTSGVSSVFSFGSTKMMTTGQGGIVLTDDQSQVEGVDRLLDYDCSSTISRSVGFNYRMSDLQAALGLSQLARLDDFIARRRAIARKYSAVLKDVPGVSLPHGKESEGRQHSYYRYVFLHDRASSIVEKLNRSGIDARPSVTHFLTDYVETAGDFPGCASVRSRIVSLPIYPSLTDSETDRIASAAAEAASI
jgi:dTDP-4-amino-4,6-dideoxygalactose transaminase